MDAVSAASAVVSLCVAGTSSLKFIHESIRNIRDGPKTVIQLLSTVDDLSGVLRKIRDVGELEGSSTEGSRGSLFEEILPTLQRYNSELDEIQHQLHKFNPSTSSISWRRLRGILQEKDVERLSNRLGRWMTALGLILANIGLGAPLRNEKALQEVQRKLLTLTSHSDEIHREIKTIGERGEKSLQAATKSQDEKLLAIQTTLDQILQSVKSSEAEWDQKSNEKLDATHIYSSISLGIEDANRAATSQASTIANLVKIIQALQLEQKPKQRKRADPKSQLKADISTAEINKDEEAINKTIKRALKRISRYQTATMDLSYNETQSIIEDLHHLTHALSRTIKPYKNVCRACSPTNHMKVLAKTTLEEIDSAIYTSRGLHIKAPQAQLKRAATVQMESDKRRRIEHKTNIGELDSDGCSPLISSVCVASPKSEPRSQYINQPYLRNRLHRKFCPKRPITVSHGHSRTTLEGDPYILAPEVSSHLAVSWPVKSAAYYWETKNARCLVQLKEHLSSLHEMNERDTTEDAETSTTSSMQVTITPTKRTNLEYKIILSIAQKKIRKATTLSVPKLVYRPIVAYGSKVFYAAQFGCVEDLRELFEKSRASLWDVDPSGRSLLNYALEAVRPSVVNFLICCGLDVDALEPNWVMLMNTPLAQTVGLEVERCERYRFLAGECRKLLLDHGADPTNSNDAGGGEFQCGSEKIYFSSPYSVTALLDHGAPLAGPNVALVDGMSPILSLSRTIGRGFADSALACDAVAILLSRGANIDAKDDDGNTALHFLFNHRDFCSTLGIEQQRWDVEDALMLFITAGADVLARNDCGLSVSDLAKRTVFFDIWIDVLRRCGYDHHSVVWGRDNTRGCSSAIQLQSQSNSYTQHTRVSLSEYLSTRQSQNMPKSFDTEVEEAIHVHTELSWFKYPTSIYNEYLEKWNDADNDDNTDDDIDEDTDQDTDEERTRYRI